MVPPGSAVILATTRYARPLGICLSGCGGVLCWQHRGSVLGGVQVARVCTPLRRRPCGADGRRVDDHDGPHPRGPQAGGTRPDLGPQDRGRPQGPVPGGSGRVAAACPWRNIHIFPRSTCPGEPADGQFVRLSGRSGIPYGGTRTVSCGDDDAKEDEFGQLQIPGWTIRSL